jgi:two-component system cell cycle response regulator
MAQGTCTNYGTSARSATATVEIFRPTMDAKAGTHICSSPFGIGPNGMVVGPKGGVGDASAYLIMVSGGMPGTMFRVHDQGTTLGRAPECTHQVLDSTVSRVHAVLTIDPGGAVYVEDKASTNGTFVNGVRLAPREAVPLRDGDRIQIGTGVILKLVRLDPHDEEFQREMFERTVRDTLTGLYNRAYFLNQIRSLAQRNAALGLGLAVMMLDVDYFKNVNDHYGHLAGDNVLREVAAVLRESTRGEDLVARYGGEEFVIALPVASVAPAAERAERIRASLARRQIHSGDNEICVTVSLGVAFSPPSRSRDEHDLILVADRALYRAKAEGRNQVVVAETTTVGPIQTDSFESI